MAKGVFKMTLEKTETNDQRVQDILDLCLKLMRGDLKARVNVSERSDNWDAIATAINMLAEELAASAERAKEAQSATLNIIEDLERERENVSLLLKERERMNKELQDFAYIVSHDLKAPLRAIGTITIWLAEDYKDKFDDAGKKQLNILLQRTQRMHKMIEGILQYSRVGRIKGTPEIVDTGKVVEQVREALSAPASIRINIQRPMPAITIDPVQINQIIQNLISNAIKYMDKQEGLIEVGCKDAGDFHEFYVKDNGPGIEEKHSERIFQIFQTLKARDEFESTGIGLTIVKKIIEQNGGRIWMESEVGQGSTFKFTLPKSGEQVN
ncbi:MAG: ATP-binding protein [Nitrospira sp.]|nr:ATP-binding protein [Nitrospira sp.]